MLKKFSISNCYSIGQEIEVSCQVNPSGAVDHSSRLAPDQKTYINMVSCFIGANASGKTNVLKALSYLMWLIDDSYTDLKPKQGTGLEQHKLIGDKDPTKFAIEFYNGGHEYQYIIHLSESEVLYERLGTKHIRGFKRIFECYRGTDKWILSKQKDFFINAKDYQRFQERKNVPLLSALLATGYLPKISFFGNRSSNVNIMGTKSFDHHQVLAAGIQLHKDQDLRAKVLQFTQEIDLGLSDFTFRKIQIEDEYFHLLECWHGDQDNKFSLPIVEESNGTQQSLVLLIYVLHILETGGIVILDEIEAGLHPDVTQKIIGLFENKGTNPKNAQLLFTTHQHVLLDYREKSQIFLLEKDKDTFATDIYRLDDVQGVRTYENYAQEYLGGAYGASPNIRWL